MVERSREGSWRDWTSSHVGPEELIQGLVILERTRETPATKHALKRSVWAQVGVHVKSSELLVSPLPSTKIDPFPLPACLFANTECSLAVI